MDTVQMFLLLGLLGCFVWLIAVIIEDVNKYNKRRKLRNGGVYNGYSDFKSF